MRLKTLRKRVALLSNSGKQLLICWTLMESDSADSEDSWKDIIILLRGNLKGGATASQVLIDILKEDDLPEVFHQLCTQYLTATEWIVRTNAGNSIKNICEKFASTLIPLATRSRSDGELLILSELDVTAISHCKDTELLCGNLCYLDLLEGNELYTKSWLKKHRKALRKRLGLEALTGDAVIAADYISSTVLLDDNDLTGRESSFPTKSKRNKTQENTENTIQCQVECQIEKKEEVENKNEDLEVSIETWFAR
jgi:hypothetical protein